MLSLNTDMRNLFKRLNSTSVMTRATGCLLVFFTVAYGSSAAFSKVRNPGDESLSIRTRMNEAYDANGIRLGDFDFSPSITNALRYTDNVYATDVGAVHDFIYSVRPDLNLRSDFVRHEINLGFSAEHGMYKDNTGEDYTDIDAAITGRFDLTGQTAMPLNLSYQREHIRRGSPDDLNVEEPTIYDLIEAGIGLVHRGHTLTMKALTDVKRYVYDENGGIAGADGSDRDRYEFSLYNSIGMAEEARLAPYVYSNLKSISYDNDFNVDGLDRDSDEIEAGVGTIVEFSEITRASFNIGYVNRSYSDSNLSDIGALTYGFNLTWEPSPLAMFLLKGDRSIEETSILGSSASVDTNISLGMDYELFPNVFLYPSVGYQERDYEDIDKTVTAYNTGLDGTYKMNQNMWLSVSYRYITQDDEGADTDGVDTYDENTYGLSLKLQF